MASKPGRPNRPLTSPPAAAGGASDPVAEQVGEGRAERLARERDQAAQERAGASLPDRVLGRRAPDYLYAAHPDHGEVVTFCPGELLPQWAAERLVCDTDGTWRIREG